jgi:hypothetical protein
MKAEKFTLTAILVCLVALSTAIFVKSSTQIELAIVFFLGGFTFLTLWLLLTWE